MKWYEKFKVGQEVRVTKKVAAWRFPNDGGCSWARDMDKTVGKTYKIIKINRSVGYLLDTYDNVGYDYWYPAESLQLLVGVQLLFSFMER